MNKIATGLSISLNVVRNVLNHTEFLSLNAIKVIQIQKQPKAISLSETQGVLTEQHNERSSLFIHMNTQRSKFMNSIFITNYCQGYPHASKPHKAVHERKAEVQAYYFHH